VGEEVSTSNFANSLVHDVSFAAPRTRSRCLGSSFFSDAKAGASFSDPGVASCSLPSTASYRPKPRWLDSHVTAFLKVPGNTTLLGFSVAGAQVIKAKSTAARAATHAAAHADVHHVSSHEDFIFGCDRKNEHLSADAFNSLTPAYSMTGWAVAAKMSFDRGEEDPNASEASGWTKFVPRALIVFTVFDVMNTAVALYTHHYICDLPLRAWLLLSVLFGLPADLVIKGYSWFQKPRYRIYRITINRCRDDMVMPESYGMEKIIFFDENGFNIEEQVPCESPLEPEGNFKTFTFEFPVMVVGYQLVTSAQAPVGNDPVDWKLECSNLGAVWETMDEVEGAPMPRQRNQPTQVFDALLTVEENAAFRQAFVMEVIFSAGAFVWLVLGTSWVARASESCIDSAPPLWLYCYCLVVFAWSLMGTITCGLIVSAVAMIILGVKSPQ